MFHPWATTMYRNTVVRVVTIPSFRMWSQRHTRQEEGQRREPNAPGTQP